MTRFGAVVISPHVGEIRLREVALQVGDGEQFTVRVLDRTGVERQFHLRFAEKWASAWQRQLQCPRCGGPAVVLRVFEHLVLCRRCGDRPTAHHRNKNRSDWQTEGAFADGICRTLLRQGSSVRTYPTARRLAAHLKRNSTQRAAWALDTADSLAQAIDNAELLER